MGIICSSGSSTFRLLALFDEKASSGVVFAQILAYWSERVRFKGFSWCFGLGFFGGFWKSRQASEA